MSLNQLPSREYTFNVDVIGENTGNKYTGKFTVNVVISLGEQLNLERDISRYIAEYQNPTSRLQALAVMLCTIKYHTITAPEWWDLNTNGTDLLDEAPVIEIYKQINESKNKWKEKIANKAIESAKKTKTASSEEVASSTDPLAR